jgi:hypothetical protein
LVTEGDGEDQLFFSMLKMSVIINVTHDFKMCNDMKWRKSNSPERIHELLLQSDVLTSKETGVMPTRDFKTTQNLVSCGETYELYSTKSIKATFSISSKCPHYINRLLFEPAHNPAYLRRIAFSSECFESSMYQGLAFYRLLRFVVETCRQKHVDVIRAEINPTLSSLSKAMHLFGFTQVTGKFHDGLYSKQYLNLSLGDMP